MPNHPKRPRDLNQWAKHMVDLATAQTCDSPPQKQKVKSSKSKRAQAKARAK
jgi:hypothetical protein